MFGRVARTDRRDAVVADFGSDGATVSRCVGLPLQPWILRALRRREAEQGRRLQDARQFASPDRFVRHHARISAGAGIGADRYEEPGYNTFPLFGTFRYRPIRTFLDTYVYTNLGYGVFTREDSIYPGWMWDAGVGYTKMFRKHFGLNFQVGYNLKEFHGQNFYGIDPDSGADYVRKFNSVRHSLSLGVGLVF